MQPYTERSANLEDQPATNVHSNVDDIVGANVRMTVQEAAAALGITVEAVRGRVHRGKYGREKTDDGRVFVVLTPDQLMNGRERSSFAQANVSYESTESNDERSPNQPPHVRNQSADNGQLVEELRDHLAFLRAELEARNEEIRRREEEHREEARRKDTIIAQLTQRIPELPSAASPEARNGSEMDSEDTDKDNVPPEPQKPPERRSWLHRFFGFE
jgi:molybdopterin converting factor small subunit